MKKYFSFDGTISGKSYFIRSLLQTLLILFIVGFYLLAVTSYKRASALTDKNWLKILAAISGPLLSVNQILTAGEADAEFMAENMPAIYFFIMFAFLILHLWLLFCLLYTSPSPRDAHESRMPSSA